MKTLQRLTLLVLVALSLNACNWDDDDFLGTWESYAYCDGYDEYELYDYERVVYAFYNDGTGYYSQYDSYYNRWYTTDFRWDEYSHGHLYLRHSDGLTEDFYYRFDHGDMLVSESPSMYTYTVFSYQGRHYR